uniref:Uncharacterized protein n=2 Tax=Panagrolaimus sp. JU765 TaxID=591449 RepID=A0AC34R352_9BILA
MPKNLLRLSLPKDDVKLVFKEFNWPMTKDEEDVLQMKVEKKYAFNAEDEIVPTITCSDGISESQDTPLSRHQRTRQPTAVSLADDAPSGKKRRLESFPSNAETEMNNVFETKSVHEDTSDSLTNVSNSNSPHPAVENDPMSDLDDELWINVNNSPKKGRRFPQIRPAHINLDTPPNNEIPSCSNLLDEAQSTTENIQSIFDNTIKDMLKQANRNTSDSLTNVSNSNSPQPAVENDPMSDLDDELWMNNSPKKGRRFPQIRPAHINLDTPPNNEIPSCSNSVNEAQTGTTENIKSIFDNTVKAMLKQANQTDVLLDDLSQIPIIKELKRNIEQGVEYITNLKSKDLKEIEKINDRFIFNKQ